MADLSLKIVPKTRAQRRELDRAAHAAGLKTGPWVLSVALGVARVGQAAKGAPGPQNPPSGYGLDYQPGDRITIGKGPSL